MALLEGNNEQVVEARTRISAHVHDVRINDFDERTNHFSGCYAKKLIFLRRLSHDRSGVNRITAARDFSNPEYRKLCGVPVMAEVIPEWPLHPSFISGHDPLPHELRIRGNPPSETLSRDHP